ncbi:MAG: ABC transporter permease [Candidatus Spyradocola sp.]|jgi:ABC-2 type transport system permease protein
MKTLRLIGYYILIKYKVMFQYRASMVIASISQILNYFVDILILWILVSKFSNLGSWDAREVVALYSMQLLTYSIAGMFCFGCCNYLSDRIRSGEFDDSLTLPVPTLLHEIFSNYTTEYIRHFVLALVFFVLSLLELRIPFTWGKATIVLTNVLGGAAINAAFMIVLSAANFFLIRGTSLLDLFYYEMLPFARYPLTILPNFVQRVFTFLLPYGFLSYYPTVVILNKVEATGMNLHLLRWVTPCLGFALLFLSVILWQKASKKYQSTGT